MDDIFFVIKKTELEELFNLDTISFKDIKDKLLDQKVEIDALKEEIREIKADREENYTPNSINYYIDLGLRESDFH